MSRPSDPTNASDLTYYAPRPLRERAKSAQEARSEPTRSPVFDHPSIDVLPKKSIYLRHPPALESRLEDADGEPELRRTTSFGVAGRFAAAAAFVATVVLLFIFVLPASRQSEASSPPSEISGSIQNASPQVTQAESGAKPALSEFQNLLASAPDSKPARQEQSPELLQRFLQWAQKAN